MAFVELQPRKPGILPRKKGVYVEIKKALYKPRKENTERKWDLLFQVHISILADWGVTPGDSVNILIDNESNQKLIKCKLKKTDSPDGAYRLCKNSPTLGYMRIRWPNFLSTPTSEEKYAANYEIKNSELLIVAGKENET